MCFGPHIKLKRTITEKMSRKIHLLFIFLAIFVVGTISRSAAADLAEDKQALLDFLHNISHSHSLNWNESFSICKSWIGVICNSNKYRVVELRLPGVGFRGHVPPNTLSRLSALQILSMRFNSLSGPFPSDFSKLGNLTSLYLQFNKFSGPLPSDFSVWNNLTIINLSNNGFNGSIPSSISNLTHLTSLRLANNSLSGPIPNISIPTLQELDLENNNLTGVVPPSLKRFPSWAFSGNDLSSENIIPPSLQVEPSRKTKKLSVPALLAIALYGCVLGFGLVALLMIACCTNKEGENGSVGVSENQDKTNRLFFFDGCNLAFDFEDLLKASAQMLEKGTFGTTYKAALEDDTTLVVKRIGEVTVGKHDFKQQMEIVGSIRHENVTPLRAYYYSKYMKLMVYDYYEQGSVSAILHGKRGEGRVPVDWESRLRIAVGTARGIAHIHEQNSGKLFHGNIKASNVFLNSQGYGCVSDIFLAKLINPMPSPAARYGGYRAPEVTDTRKASQVADVYSFGVLLLEVLTGKSPVYTTGTGEVVHLVKWVKTVIRERWTTEVFDVELLRYPNIEEEMIEILQVGMSCVARFPEQRPKITEVVKRLEEIHPVNNGDHPSSDSKSEISLPTPVLLAAADIGPSSVPQ
ncbi:hypothetical protein UlMin_027982 [Ulmus minor]